MARDFKIPVTVAGVDVMTRAFTLGKAGVIAASAADAADFPLVVPFNFTLQRMKVTMLVGPTGAMAVQLRKASQPITTLPTYSDVSGFVVTFSASNVLAIVDPTDVDITEGDFLNFSCTTGSGTNLLLELIGKMR